MTHPGILLPALVAHRGYSAAAPENTLAAVRAAFDAGATWVELDVQLLGDATPVIWHDADAARCSDGRGELKDLDLEAAKQLDVGAWFGDEFAGERMATLDEMLTLLDELHMGVNLEIKVNKGRDAIALVDTVLPMLVEKIPANRLIVSSFDLEALRRCREFASSKTLALGVLFGAVPEQWQAMCEDVDAYSVHPDWARLKRPQTEAMAAAGYQVLCYTPNDPAAFEPRWRWGVTCAITDEPVAFKRFLDHRDRA
ncbi:MULTISPECIES: glycerophosphodiester phosphodiesterase family protein [unclassified Halomonas]|uniref:glycerophosphodiester phosphodiesterase family protein n=1 Tax=unclassified Halomonas TaxID=2609666 RepID=UPI00209CB5BD|nr:MULTISPECIES: glycerophosphodiester phosphodiesterase family protein [unclassified Halomonas]MCP1315029.1 glycerophosphoryl diester phosphodiesterase [Halomonas sp. 707D7]MCP1325606.1 glycerophosphoryl diester phosphodiesterase [Halomonas sp. 707D4]